MAEGKNLSNKCSQNSKIRKKRNWRKMYTEWKQTMWVHAFMFKLYLAFFLLWLVWAFIDAILLGNINKWIN